MLRLHQDQGQLRWNPRHIARRTFHERPSKNRTEVEARDRSRRQPFSYVLRSCRSASLALIIRTVSSSARCATTTRRPEYVSPSNNSLCSPYEWSGSSMVNDSGSANAVDASSNVTPCFAVLRRALSGSQTNSIDYEVTASVSKMEAQSRPVSPEVYSPRAAGLPVRATLASQQSSTSSAPHN